MNAVVGSLEVVGEGRAARKFNSRKWILVLLVIVLATALLVAKLIAAADFVDLAKWSMGFYMAGNVGAAGIDVLQTYVGRRSPSP